ncbi:hypothetical protein DW775_06070 [Agathobacter rectalis]|uniref:Uncharacterized protein n=1 Tax=Agathobacter rectalis TaxID=39491 RepID=A0A414HZ75_9FIRM|nr:hypothetical protein DW775_06070 [Agathobacter rectalis]HAR01614.1 hypothetical protein [Eubacterium sp.]HBM94768.1 hypothetical protein [Eubacterium sp.]
MSSFLSNHLLPVILVLILPLRLSNIKQTHMFNYLQFIFFTASIFTGSKIKTPMKATNCDLHGSLIVYIAEIITQ